MKIYIETYGCSSSKSDSEIMAGLLSRNFKIADKIERADIVIINTCIVKTRTENKMTTRIRNIQEKYPKKKLIIAGCMPEAEYELVKRIAPSASLISTNMINEIEKVVRKTVKGERIELIGKEKSSKVRLPKMRKNPVIDIVEICSGCNHNCSYCITKFAKGSLCSYSNAEIIREIKTAYENGCKEFWITGQDVAAYNYSAKKLPSLLKEIIDKVDGNYFLRLGMMNPASVLPILNELIEVYKDRHIFKFLHLPVQSGSNKILKGMKRDYSASDFRKIISKFRKAIPEITIWTDIIVGFPDENEEDFQKILSLIKNTKPDFVNVSRFGARPNTMAAKMKQLPVVARRERSKIVSKLVDKISLEKNRKWLNWSGPVLIDEYNSHKKTWIARNYAYKPIAVSGNFISGQLADVKVIKAGRSLIGSCKD